MRKMNTEQKIHAVMVALLVVGLVTFLVAQMWWYALGAAVLVVVVALFRPKNDDALTRRLGELKDVPVTAAEIRAYRKDHPDLSLVEATVAVKEAKLQ